jgi:hypothetical protein
MIKKLSFTVAGLVIFALALKLTLVLVAIKASEQIRSEAIKTLAFDYGSFSVSVSSGEIHYDNVSLKLFELKREVSVNRLTVDFGNPFGLMIGLPAMYFKDPSYVESVRLESAETEFLDEPFYEWLDEQNTTKPKLWSAALSCSGLNPLGRESFNKMGIENLAFDLYIELDQFAGAQPLNLNVTADLDKIARVKANWELKVQEKNQYEVQSIAFDVVEQGFFRRIYNSCGTNVPREAFVAQTVSAWQEMMAYAYIRMGSGLTDIMRDYLVAGGQVQIQADRKAPSKPIAPEEAREITEAWDLFAAVNQEESVRLNAYYEPPIIVEPIVAPTANATISEPASYVVLELQDLDLMTGQQLKLVLNNGKVFEGVAVVIGPHYVELVPVDGDGKVSFSLERIEIATIEVWR